MKQAITNAKNLAFEVDAAFTMWITFRGKRHEDRLMVAKRDLYLHLKKHNLQVARDSFGNQSFVPAVQA